MGEQTPVDTYWEQVVYRFIESRLKTREQWAQEQAACVHLRRFAKHVTWEVGRAS